MELFEQPVDFTEFFSVLPGTPWGQDLSSDEDLQNGLDTLDGVFDDVDGVRDPITEMEIEEEAGGFV
jgi:hypothetical protein